MKVFEGKDCRTRKPIFGPLLFVNAGSVDSSSSGCRMKPLIASGRISIREESPRIIVVFESWSSKKIIPI